MFNDRSTPLSLLATRRSAKARDLVAPGPDPAELRHIVEIATRTPDHGKLFPWRFVIVPDHRRDAFAALLRDALRIERPGASARDIDAVVDDFAYQAPALVVVLSAPVHGHKIPLWEQELSAGAATMNLLHAVHASGYAAAWLTGWAAFSDMVRAGFAGPERRIAGFVFIGTPSRPLEERPRPDPDAVIADWTGSAPDGF
ncbi:nitroreductase [Sphingomonas sp.]|uniref:nitroreductase family protein n=1 Tax=Sphingomonas sp. TaxID=28214 RepID=UPI001EC021A1|nr:nitroreductase [Sphingomonas sp.]MBX3593205.1 nitroreductase [Sphingomonas sp.]